MERDPKLLEVFVQCSDENFLDNRTKATLRLCSHQIKKLIDATVISCKIKSADVDLVCNCDWKLKELSIKRLWAHEPVTVLPNALVKKFSLLETLKFEEYHQLDVLPENFIELIHLTDLRIYSYIFATVPPSLRQLTSLALYACPALTQEGLAPLKQLQQLKILKLGGRFLSSEPLSIEWICDDVTTGLLELDLRGSLESLPPTISNFKKLTSLTLKYGHFHELPDSVGLLSSLQNLEISNAVGAIPGEIPGCFRKLTALKDLSLYVHLDGIALLQRLTGLTHLELIFHDIRYTMDVIWNLTGLKSLHLVNYRDGQIEGGFSLSEDISKLKNLESLQIKDLRNLHKLPKSIGTLSCLTELIISFTGVESLPDSIGILKGLKSLEICHCPILQLPSSIGCLDSLEELRLSSCDKLRRLPGTMGKLDALKVFSISSCYGLTTIPGSFADLILRKYDYDDWSLEKVVIIFCPKLRSSRKMKQAMQLLRSRGMLVER